jgi:creatinine amidohydrolase/Fe(II)-dependent formamide hydrolase-like protein
VSAEIMASRKVDIKEGKFTHAGEIMTSVIMAIAPEDGEDG